MKLHTIEVTNLNSLYDVQSVDLDRDLEGASLFLIRGPTGSGKSTLMDAVSLALFGTTPRLSHLRSSIAVAEQIMSRGTGTCAAQVEFSKLESGTGVRVRYRARWLARRSRNKPDGNMRPVHRSLERLGGNGEWENIVSDHRDSRTGPQFEEVLEGFTVKDFQRSMLLAQGQFDAMLHATAAERASILERLTDTSDYQRIGALAYRMNKAWGSRIGKLSTTVQAISPVGQEELEAARAAVQDGTAVLRKLAAEVRRVEEQQRWLSDVARCEKQAEQVASAQEELEEKQATAQEALQSLAEAERCQPGLELLDKEEAAMVRRAQAQKRHDDTQEQLPELTKTLRTAKEAADKAVELHREAVRGLSHLREPVASAEKSQEALATAAREADRSRQQHRLATERLNEATEAVLGAEQAVVLGQEEWEKSEEKRREVASDEALAAVLPELESRAAAVEAQRAEVERERASIAQAEQAAATQQDVLGDREEQHQQALKLEVEPLRVAAKSAAEQLAELAGDEQPGAVLSRLHREALAAQERESQLQKAVAALTRRAETQQVLVEAEQAVERERQARKRCVALLSALKTELDQSARSVELADQVLAPLERVALYAEQREVLVAGEECPLCGSTEHPHAGQAAAVARELEQARQARSEAEQQWRAVDQRLRDAASAQAAVQARLEGAETALGKASAEHSRQSAATVVLLGVCELADDATSAQVQRAQQALHDAAEARSTAQEELEYAQVQATAAQQKLAQAEQQFQAEAQALAEERARCNQQATNLRERHEQLEERADEVRARTEALLADLQAEGVVASAVKPALKLARDRVGVWTSAVEGAAEAHRKLETLRASHEAAKKAKEAAAVAESEEAAQLKEREATLRGATQRHAEAREALSAAWAAAQGQALLADGEQLDSLAPSELLRRQDVRTKRLQQQEQAASLACSTAEKAHTEAVSRREEQQQQLTSIDTELEELAQRLQASLAELKLRDREALLARRLDPEVQRSAVELRDSLRSDTAALQGRKVALQQEQERLRVARPPELAADADAEQLAQQLVELEAQREETQEAVQTARSTVDHSNRQAEALAAAHEKLKQARSKGEVWRELSRLIGTNEGGAFKQFAQALNLDQLLLRANRHLRILNPRYQLYTVKNEETGLPTLDFEVADTWFTGATRSLKTLSGGESFLVSLALALGLSDLRTRSMPVETLLLDEGFGTLDPDTLNTALEALEQLQMSGRQVGIISHVVGLEEKVQARILVEPLGGGHSRVRAENRLR